MPLSITCAGTGPGSAFHTFGADPLATDMQLDGERDVSACAAARPAGGGRLVCCRSSRSAGFGRATSSSASMSPISASIILSSRLSWSALSCSLRRAKRWRCSTAECRGQSQGSASAEGGKNPKPGEIPRFGLLIHRNLDIHFRVLLPRNKWSLTLPSKAQSKSQVAFQCHQKSKSNPAKSPRLPTAKAEDTELADATHIRFNII